MKTNSKNQTKIEKKFDLEVKKREFFDFFNSHREHSESIGNIVRNYVFDGDFKKFIDSLDMGDLVKVLSGKYKNNIVYFQGYYNDIACFVTSDKKEFFVNSEEDYDDSFELLFKCNRLGVRKKKIKIEKVKGRNNFLKDYKPKFTEKEIKLKDILRNYNIYETGGLLQVRLDDECELDMVERYGVYINTNKEAKQAFDLFNKKGYIGNFIPLSKEKLKDSTLRVEASRKGTVSYGSYTVLMHGVITLEDIENIEKLPKEKRYFTIEDKKATKEEIDNLIGMDFNLLETFFIEEKLIGEFHAKGGVVFQEDKSYMLGYGGRDGEDGYVMFKSINGGIKKIRNKFVDKRRYLPSSKSELKDIDIQYKNFIVIAVKTDDFNGYLVLDYFGEEISRKEIRGDNEEILEIAEEDFKLEASI